MTGKPALSQAQTGTLRVLIVQDHPLLASAIAAVLNTHDDLIVVGIASNGKQAARLAAQEKPSVVLMDFLLPDMAGPAAAARIRAEVPSAVIVFHSAENSEEALLDAIDAGATAYLTKEATSDQLIEAVRRASIGEVLIPVGLFAKAIARQRKVITDGEARDELLADFTPRELDVLRLLAEGLDTMTLAERLGVAPNTIDWHVSHLIEKLQVHSKLQAVIAAARLGLIEL
jgi:DNA-binding NarL/FixJ family response regulator